MDPKVKSVFEEQVEAGKQKENSTNIWKLEEVEEALTNVQLPEELHPESYRINSPKEEQLLEIADNFQHQYLLLYPDRKPLLLFPVNECGVRKFVSTTLRPTQTGLWELQSWQDCSSFVADFLTVQPLEPPSEVPTQLFSPTSVLRNQKATCFESSTLLCSLLLGLNYDAYCVSGYASREMCLLDQSLQQCPLLDMEVESVQSEISEQKHQEQKYGLRPQRQLRSHFLKEQEQKKQEAVAALFQEKELQEENSQLSPDSLRGLRVYCWVLVLSGIRSIKENFFIDPLTGSRFPTNDDNFHGIESVWNSFNYYVNRQECINGCRDVLFDLEDSSQWETVLHNGISQQQLTRTVQRRQENRIIGTTTSDMEEVIPRKFLFLRSWVSSIVVSEKDLEARFPGGRKVTRYRKAKLERFSPTVTKDGLVSRLTTYKDLDCTEVTEVKEWYKNRSDGLEERNFNKLENSTAEHFKPGRAFALLFHMWTPLTSGTERETRFHRPEQDGLERRVVSPQAMEEYFKDRDDFLYFRHVTFSRSIQSLTPFPLKTSLENLHVLKVVERFHRNTSKPVTEDVAQRVFLVPQMQIKLTYHLMDHRTIPSRRSITKPKDDQPFTEDMFSTFQVEQSKKPLGPLLWCSMVEDLINEEEKVALQIKVSLMEMENILDSREQEENNLKVFSSELEQVMACREKWEEERTSKEDLFMIHEQEMNVLVPFLSQLESSDALNSEEVRSLCVDCLARFKERLEEHTSFLQKNLETVIENQEADEDHQHDPAMSMQEAELTCHLCWNKNFYISAAQRRLDKHKEKLEDKCKAFLLKLHQEPLLAPHFES